VNKTILGISLVLALSGQAGPGARPSRRTCRNNQHSENENLCLGRIWKGIVTMAALLTIEAE